VYICDLVGLAFRKAETVHDGNQGANGEEGSRLFHLLGDDSPAPFRHYTVDFSQDLGYFDISGVRLVVRDLRAVWMSHEYMASRRRGDQARKADLMAS
jgi:hypothetical protein